MSYFNMPVVLPSCPDNKSMVWLLRAFVHSIITVVHNWLLPVAGFHHQEDFHALMRWRNPATQKPLHNAPCMKQIRFYDGLSVASKIFLVNCRGNRLRCSFWESVWKSYPSINANEHYFQFCYMNMNIAIKLSALVAC